MTAPHDRTPTNGPAVTFTALVPDVHHYAGRGGRAFPVWSDTAGTEPNVRPALLAKLAEAYDAPVSAEDVVAYIAAAAAHPGYTARFAPNLVQPGLRVPVTADAALFAEAAALGREVVWLHTFGERFAAPAEGRPAAAPRMPEGQRPQIPEGGDIPFSAEAMPGEISYDAAVRRLRVGAGRVDNVLPEVWAYEVSGKQVLTQWFSYRGRHRSRPIIGDRRPPSPLGELQPKGWLPEYTAELLDLLNVLGRLVALEARQAELLGRICAGSTIHPDDFNASAPHAAAARRKSARRRNEKQGDLLG